jgi:hypothetical protein
LSEYDERSALLWQARTRADLDELVADLPARRTCRPHRPPSAAVPVRGGPSR